VSIIDGSDPIVVPNSEGNRTTPSVVAFAKNGERLVGHIAKRQAITNPEQTIYSVKRFMGCRWNEVKADAEKISYIIEKGNKDEVAIKIKDRTFRPEEISAMILQNLKHVVEEHTGEEVTQAVITVPAYFNDAQRQSTKDAGRIAGLEVMRIINEPTAAALAYGFGKGLNQKVAVYDLGGGTFDVSVLEIGRDIFEVLSTCGDTFLGGDDFDDRIIDLLADEFMGKEGINLRDDAFAFEKLKVAAENAKKGLSVEDEVEIRIPDVITGEDGQSRSIERKVTANEFATLVNDLIQRTFKVCDEAMQQADLTVRELDGIILVGGPTRLPVIHESVKAYFQKATQSDVDPDEVVAMGAAIHASSLVNQDQDSFLLDVTPLDLRIGVAGGLAEPVIERNTPVPIEQSRRFTTYQDHQEMVKIRVYQGDSRQAEENELLGQFEFSGFRKAARGEVTIEVTFEINTDGIVNVTASDLETGEATSAAITLSSGLSDAELEEIIEENPTERVTTSAPDDAAPRPAAPAAPSAPAPAGDDDLELLGDDDDLELLDDGELVALAQDGGAELELDDVVSGGDGSPSISVSDLDGNPDEMVPIEGREAPRPRPASAAPAQEAGDVRDELFDSTPTDLSGEDE
jgi:molecular chaperone DnaK